jgi:ABC-type branched-subunit amino acid transport system substrate-binding protein
MSLNTKIVFLVLIIAIISADSIIIFAEGENKIIYSNWIIIFGASIAVSLAVYVVYRQKLKGLHGKTHAAIAIGLSLWLCANITWTVYENVLHIVPPVPSLADAFWLSAYGFFAYHLLSVYKEYREKFNRSVLIGSIIGSILFLGYLISFTASLSVLTTERGIIMFSVIIAYPILNSILTVLAIVILTGFRKEQFWSISWIFESLALLCIVVADSWFALVVLTGLVEQLWISALFLPAHYLVISAGLLWFIKFLIVEHNKDSARLAKQGSRSSSRSTSPPPPSSSASLVSADTASSTSRRRILVVAAIAGAVLSVPLILIIFYSYNNLPLPSGSSTSLHSSTTTASNVMALQPNRTIETITIGALLPLTGTLSSSGETTHEALKVAVEDVNEYFFETNSHVRTQLIVGDTKTSPSSAPESLKSVLGEKEEDVRIIIGPATSAAVQAVKDYADKNGILLVSHSSTAPSLAIAGDNLFRFVPDDTHQGEAIAKKMWNDGVRIVVPMWRSDNYGNELYKSMKENFEKLGGVVVTDGIGYRPYTGQFAASLNRINFIIWDQELKSLNYKVSKAVEAYGADKVGVYLISFDEVVPILIQAQNHPMLDRVKWYGSDGTAHNEAVIRNIEAAKFAVKTNFLNPLAGGGGRIPYYVGILGGAEETEKNENVELLDDKIRKRIGEFHSSYDDYAYDAFWVAALSEAAALKDQGKNSTVTAETNYIDFLKKTFVDIAGSHSGITGKTILNEYGDKKLGYYDFWALGDKDDDDNNNLDFHWVRVGKAQFTSSK